LGESAGPGGGLDEVDLRVGGCLNANLADR
jgi:hypothetical protein